MRMRATLLVATALFFQASAAPVPAGVPVVTLADVINDPKDYDGRRVRLHGFLILKFEGNALYLSEADFRAQRYDRSLWVDETSRRPDAQRLTGKLAFVSGVIDAGNPGHMGLRPAALVDVSDITVDPADTASARPWVNDPLFLILASLGLLGLFFAVVAMVSRVRNSTRGL